MAYVISKAQLLDRLRTERRRLERMLARLSEAQMVQPGVHHKWSVKDILAHIAIWDERGTRWIREAAQGHIPAIPEPGRTWADLDQLNEQTYLSNRHRPLQEVLADFQRTFAQLM